MAKILLIVMDFASHRTWAEGYARVAAAASTTSSSSPSMSMSSSSSSSQPQPQPQHHVKIHVVPGDRWKWRMQTGAAAELDSIVSAMEDDDDDDDVPDVIVVDGMLDVTLLVAMLNNSRSSNGTSRRKKRQPPRILVYLHENQITTPFTHQDRDKQGQTHWHYGICHWRSLLVSDGFIFNSRQHYEAFAVALPKLIKQQCPHNDGTVEWHLQRAQQLLQTKCTVLRYGLELEELAALARYSDTDVDGTAVNTDDDIKLSPIKTTTTTTTTRPNSPSTPATVIDNKRAKTVPVILWNARLEEDKDPETFLQVLAQLKQQYTRQHHNGPAFQLVVLGTDPSKGQTWYGRIRQEFAENELLFLGWCHDRAEYAQWLAQASIVVSTARHETFGISIVESVYCGALPLLPLRLSYPELFPMNNIDGDDEDFFAKHFFYRNTKECVRKLAASLQLVTKPSSQEYIEAVRRARSAVAQFRWSVMAPVYNDFFQALVDGEDLVSAGLAAEAAAAARNIALESSSKTNSLSTVGNGGVDSIGAGASLTMITITDPSDSRVALFRPKSLRDHMEYHKQLASLRADGIAPSLHGGRRCSIRLLEAMSTGARIQVHSFLTTAELAKNCLQRVSGDTPIYIAEKSLLDIIRGQKLNTGDAILAMVRFPMVSPLSDLVQNPPILILEHVRNAENLGSILRTAFCLGITSIVVSSTSWAALSDSRSARCSMGTIYYHKFYKSEKLETTIPEIQKHGICVYGIEIGPEAKPIVPHGSDAKWAAVMGNEDLGMTCSVRRVCDSIVFVPQAHGDSLNVGHAAAISMFELGRESPLPQHDGRAACK